MPEEDLLTKEYFTLQDLIKDFDQRLITIKGWGVTLSLAALGIGFQYRHYGLFLVAAISGLAFGAVEGAIKRHQMRHYVRIREIEVITYSLKSEDNTQIITPQINWSWTIAPQYFRGKVKGSPPPPERFGKEVYDLRVLFFPHILFPHFLSVIVGGILFVLGVLGILGMPI